MLTQAESEFFAQVGPGTPMGELLRPYRHPIATESDVDMPFEPACLPLRINA
jgi:hypothetical protein